MSNPGRYEFQFNTNPLLPTMPASITPAKFGAPENVRMTVASVDNGASLVHLESVAHFDQVLRNLMEGRPKNIDIICSHLLHECKRHVGAT